MRRAGFGGLALALAVALGLTWSDREPSAEAREPNRAAAPTRTAERIEPVALEFSPVPPPATPAIPPAAPAPAQRDLSPPVPAGDSAATTPTAPVERSWVVPLELGWDGAEAGDAIETPVRFRPQTALSGDVCFTASVVAADGSRASYPLPVAGLIPRELADGRDELVAGDQVFVARAPVLLRLPIAPLPLQVELRSPSGELAATLEVCAGEREPRVTVR